MERWRHSWFGTQLRGVLVNDADVQRIARQLELALGYPPKVQMTALAGFIPFHIGDLKSAIEVVRRIPGISDAHWFMRVCRQSSRRHGGQLRNWKPTPNFWPKCRPR
jgi:hypothetical protein